MTQSVPNEDKRPARRSAKITALLLMATVVLGLVFGVRALLGGGASADAPAPGTDVPIETTSYIYDAQGIRFAFSLQSDGTLRGDNFYGVVPEGWHFDESGVSADGVAERIALLKTDSATGADAISLTVLSDTEPVTAMNADDFPVERADEYRAQGLEGAEVELRDFVSKRAMDRDFVRVRYLLRVGEASLFCDELYIDDGDRCIFIKMVGAADDYDQSAFLRFTEGFGFYNVL